MPGACKELQLEFASSHVSHCTSASQAQTCIPLLGSRRRNGSKRSWADQGTVQPWALTPALDVLQVPWAQHGLFQLPEWWQGQSTARTSCTAIASPPEEPCTAQASLLPFYRQGNRWKRGYNNFLPYVLTVGEPTKSNLSDSWFCAIPTKPCLTLLYVHPRTLMVHYSFHCTQQDI